MYESKKYRVNAQLKHVYFWGYNFSNKVNFVFEMCTFPFVHMLIKYRTSKPVGFSLLIFMLVVVSLPYFGKKIHYK